MSTRTTRELGNTSTRCIKCGLHPAKCKCSFAMTRQLITLTQDIKGNFSTWKKGERVKMQRVKGHRWVILEKLKRNPSGVLKDGLPIMNQIAIPLRGLKYKP